LAVDVHSAAEPKRINWLIANVKEFGFSWEVVPSEPWHIRYVCGDNPPPAVAAWMEKNGVNKPEAGVANLNNTPAGGNAKTKAVQEALKKKGIYAGPINGEMDAATKEAIKSFKVANKLPADSVPGPKVMQLLGLK